MVDTLSCVCPHQLRFESFWKTVQPFFMRGRLRIYGHIIPMFAKIDFFMKSRGDLFFAHDSSKVDHDMAIAAFLRHIEDMKRLIPADRLLVYDVCFFLSFDGD